MRCLVACAIVGVAKRLAIWIAAGFALILMGFAIADQASAQMPRFCQVSTADAALRASSAAGKNPSHIVLLVDQPEVLPGKRIYARLANFGTTAVGYGREFRIEYRTNDGWELDPASPKGPWPRMWGRIDPGEAGRCNVFRVPRRRLAGKYRFSTGVQLSPKTKRGLVWRHGTFMVVQGDSLAAMAEGADPVVEEWPRWPYLTSCGGDMSFDPVSVFSEPARAEKGSLPSEVALRELLATNQISYARHHHWRKVAEDEDTAEFIQGRALHGVEWVELQYEEAHWKPWRYSSRCEPTSIVGRGPVVGWRLAEDREADERVRTIHVNLGPGPCSSGKPQNPRAQLVWRWLGRKLLLTIWLKSLPPGIYTCQGLIEPPLKVTLPRKVPLRRLIDGSTYPPRPAIRP